MPNTLTSIFVSTPATEPVEAPHPNTGVYVTGTQATVGGPWTVVHTLITRTTTPLTMVGRLKNFPTVTVAVVAAGGPNAGNIFNNILATPTGTAATATSSTALNVVVSSIANQTGYRLLSSDTQTGTYTQIYQSTAASFPHTGLTASQTKWYKWQYVGGGYYDDSPLSAAFSGATTAAATATVPVLTTLLPTSAAAGASIQISGTDLGGATSVKFGTLAATITANTATSITLTVPAGVVTSLVTVTTPAGTSNGLQFTPTGAGLLNILAVGNSITEGTQGVRWTDTLAQLVPSGTTITNRGHGGWSIDTMTKNATAASRAANGGPTGPPDVSGIAGPDVEPYYNAAAARNIIIIQEGTNNIASYDTKLAAYVTARQAEGWQVISFTVPIRTDINAAFLQSSVSINNILRANTSAAFGSRVLNLERNAKLTTFGPVLTDVTAPEHSSNNPAYNYDKVHWTPLLHKICGYMAWDMVNNLVNNIALPDPTNYPPTAALPGQQVTWATLANSVTANGGITPINTSQAQFAAGGATTEKIALVAGGGSQFCGAFQWVSETSNGGFVGVGLSNTWPGYAGIEDGYLDGTIVVNRAGTTAAGHVAGDTYRVELYTDKTIWLRNGSEVSRRLTPSSFPAQLLVSHDGGAFGGVQNVRVEGTLVAAAPVAPVATGEAMVLALLAGGAVVDANGVLSAPGAGQFAAQCNATKFLAAGSGYRGFFQVTALGSQANGSFFGTGVAGGGKVDITYGMLLINGAIIPLNNKAGMNSPGGFAANDVLRADYYGPDATSPDLPNGGARYYKNGALLVSVPGALAFPLYCDFAISALSSLGTLRIGGPGLST